VFRRRALKDEIDSPASSHSWRGLGAIDEVTQGGLGLLVVSARGVNPTALPFDADQFEARRALLQLVLRHRHDGHVAVAHCPGVRPGEGSRSLGFAFPTARRPCSSARGCTCVYLPLEGRAGGRRKWRLRLAAVTPRRRAAAGRAPLQLQPFLNWRRADVVACSGSLPHAAAQLNKRGHLQHAPGGGEVHQTSIRRGKSKNISQIVLCIVKINYRTYIYDTSFSV
jgi:hypothetical protein